MSHVLRYFVGACVFVFAALSISQFSRLLGDFGSTLEFLAKGAASAGAIGTAILALVARHKFRVRFVPLSLLLLLGVATLSLLWSYDRVDSIKALGALTLCISVTFLVANGDIPAKYVFTCVGAGLVLMTVLSLAVGAAQAPNTWEFKDGLWRLAGVTYGPHAVARAGVFAFAIALLREERPGWRWGAFSAGLFLLALAACVESASRQSLGLLGLACFVWGWRRFGPRASLITGALLISLALVVVALGGFSFDSILRLVAREDVNDVLTLTNRTRVWDVVSSTLIDNPVLGIGFGAGASFLLEYFSLEWGWTTTTAHNMFLQVLLELGAVGLLCYAFMLYQMSVAAVRERNAMVTFVVLSCWMLSPVENALAATPDYLFLLASVGMIRHARRVP